MNQLINEQRERIAHLERVNDGLSSAIEKMELAAKDLGYNNSMTCSELEYLVETARAVAMVNSKNLELTSQLAAVKESGGTGQSPCAKFCESVALGKDFYQLREHADKMQVERDTLKQQNAELLAQISDAFGDGYYDGFVDGAKHQDNVDLNTKSQGGLAQIQDDALRCSEIAESEKSKRFGIASRQELAAQVELLRDALDKISNWNELPLEYRVNFGSNGQRDYYRNIASVALKTTPAQCLLEVKADAVRAAFRPLKAEWEMIAPNEVVTEEKLERLISLIYKTTKHED
jgi:hypothetical protein